jgi:hypothetical protein
MAVIHSPAKDHPMGLRPWLGLAVSPLAWIAAQQGMGDLARLACRSAGPPLGPLLGLAAAAVCVLCGWLSWSANGPGLRGLKRFVCLTSVGVAALFAGGALLVTLASLVIPPCAR